MRNKFLTHTLCSSIKTPPKDYISNIIDKHASWKLICKHDVICKIATDKVFSIICYVIIILICDNKPTVYKLARSNECKCDY